MTYDEAALADKGGLVNEAASKYEELLLRGDCAVDVFVDLAVLYWQATDVGFAAARGLSPAFMAHAGGRYPSVLEQALVRFPDSDKVKFWKRYISWADGGGEPPDLDECRVSLKKIAPAVEPAMYLFSATGGQEARSEALNLLQECNKLGTVRARYVASVIEATLNRAKM